MKLPLSARTAITWIAVALETTVVQSADLGSDVNNVGCIASAGFVYCPETNSCIRPWNTNCPVEGTTYTGPVDVQCSDGRCTDPTGSCEIEVGSSTIGGLYLTDLDGNYTLPDGCSVTCQGCAAQGDGSATIEGDSSAVATTIASVVSIVCLISGFAMIILDDL